MKNIKLTTFYTDPVFLNEYHVDFFGRYVMTLTNDYDEAEAVRKSVKEAYERGKDHNTRSIVELFAGRICIFNEHHYYPVPEGIYHEDVLAKDGEIRICAYGGESARVLNMDYVEIVRRKVTLEGLVTGLVEIMVGIRRGSIG